MKRSMKASSQLVSNPDSGLIMWVDAKQNGVVSGEPLTSGASRKTCAQTQ